ncbi:MAG: preprotein translocase subunit SecE [Betaproteobacteria bacterium]|jgi:preprotein translocase subunit SecE|nr:preprotein translocase subunit SecE [Betaproteobacteria bacterium]MDE2122645.1 preprotein translocase subunit SecE [Betaproteobacteria bacterium]MDE2187811.1 preprotein translocase subunit SecE [Betaproteobacteria bacterium]MDE2325959.1 preprotein translocase subunit SecE [Betaproteobacteria bacterium]NNM65544.1 preprotein translocase subunit SecE [Burkholderiales bacterium]
MANTNVETVSTTADKAKLGAAGAVFLAAFAAYYLLHSQELWLRVLALATLLLLAGGLFLLSEPGKALIAYTRESVREVRKVVWPERKEAIQMTAIVFGFVILMALFLWITDKSLEWIFYDLILGWKH